MDVIAERGVEIGAVAEAAVDLVGLLGTVLRVDVRLPGDEHRLRRVWKLTENGLASYDHQLVVTGDLGRGPDHVFQLRPAHR